MRNKIVLIVATLGLMPVASHAQEPATACSLIQNDQERLACYDRATHVAPPAPQAAPVPASAPAAATSPVIVAAPAVVAAPTTVTAAPAAPPPAATGANAVAPPAQAAAAPPPASATPSSTISTAPHNPRNTQPPTPPPPGSPPTFDPNTGAPTAVFPIVVVNARARPGFGTEFTTDTAGVWVQTEAKPLTLPKTPFNAKLQPGTFGSTFLVLPESKLGIRVRPPNK